MADPVISPVPGSPEHEAAMVAKFDGTAAAPVTPPADPAVTPPADPERPAWLHEKFKTPEDLAKAYSELEAKQGKPADPPAGEDPPADPPADDAAKEAVKAAGLDYTAMSEEYAANGALSDETFEKLEKAGIPRAYVDQYIAGQEAMVERLQLQAFSVVGGEENYNSMMGWAAANMTEAEINSYNQAVNSTDKSVIKLAVMGLKGRYEAANGSEPNLEGGSFNGNAGPQYESWAQVRADMRDPKYSSDPAYRKSVEQKLARSTPI